jgi:Dullard-like phosphatase family protein
MSDLLTKERNTTSNAKLKKDISELTALIKSINLQKDNDKKSNIKKKKKLISPNCFNFMSSKYLMKYSSLDTPEKQKKSSRKKNKKIKNKAKSERVVTNFFSEKKTKEKEEEEDCIEEEKIKSLKANIICYKSKKDILSFTLHSSKKYPKIDIVNSTYNINNDLYTMSNYSIYIPEKLQKQINLLSVKTIFPIDNKYGKYTKYINSVAKSIKDFIHLDYDSIFSDENSIHMKYLIYNSDSDKKLLLLDLDETLVHSEFRDSTNYKSLDKMKENSKCYNRSFSYIDKNYKYYFDIYFRPFLFDFLHEIKNYFDLAIFTASSKGYADTIINYIDPNNELFKFRLYRDACIPIQKFIFIKDLRIIKNYNPMNIILMDNSLYSFINQPSNGMLIYSFYTNHKDNQLMLAKNFLIKCIYPAKDLRIEIDKWFKFNQLLRNDNITESNTKSEEN